MIIRNGNVYNAGFRFEKNNVRTNGDTIAEIGSVTGEDKSQDIIDASGCYVIPGFVDVHTHGATGNDFTNIDNCDVNEVSAFYAGKGVTSFLATTMTEKKDKLLRVLETLGKLKGTTLKGAKMAGIHLEGPFISPKACGAQPADCIQLPGAEAFKEYFDASKGSIRIATIAPEVENSLEMIKYVKSLGVVCSCGHTKATYQQTMEAIEAGASHGTHLFNAMSSFHHREPGIIGALFDAENATVEMITDLIHVHACIVRTVYKVKGADRMIGITDSIEATGLKDGVYKLGQQTVYSKGGTATLEDGTLAGSTLTMDLALRNMVQKVGIPLENAVKILTFNPASVIGAKDIGLLKAGNKADIAVLDKDLNVKYTIIDGKLAFKA